MRKDKSRKASQFHGFSGEHLYNRWTAIVSRVTDPLNACYNNYGGRGINICNEWRHYPLFRQWALRNGYKEDLVIDRIDVNKDYCPENCRWVTKSESSINRRKRNTYCIQNNYRKFQCTIVRNRYHYYLGTYSIREEALVVRDEFLKLYSEGKHDTYHKIKSKLKYA